jgi:hypothetical protein
MKSCAVKIAEDDRAVAARGNTALDSTAEATQTARRRVGNVFSHPAGRSRPPRLPPADRDRTAS